MEDKPKLTKRIHIIGICGVATSALAIAFHKRGLTVTGSDKGFYPPVSTSLDETGIGYHAGWHPELVEANGRPDLIIAGGSGTSPSNPEALYAKEKNIPLLSFAEALAKFIIRKNSIVVAGTWGKTTSSALLSFVLIQSGLNPSYFTGGLSLSHPTGAITDSEWSVVEGDEYQVGISDKRPKFALYSPTHLLLTSASWDHADLYPTKEDYLAAFEKLLGGIPAKGAVVVCKDAPNALELVQKTGLKYISYGRADNRPADFVYKSVKHNSQGLNFEIEYNNLTYEIQSPMLGRFNAENITGVFAMAVTIGLDPEKVRDSLREFKGIKRRLEKRLEGPITVLDCHAPTAEKASAVLESIREAYPDSKIIIVYEPNIGGRQRASVSSYSGAFEKADIVFIPKLTRLKVSNSDAKKPLEGRELAEIISKTHGQASFIEDDSNLVAKLAATKKGDVIAFLGSHGFRGMIEEVVERLEIRD